MRIAVVGTGSIGGHLAVRLAEGGATVTAVARGATLAAIRERGLTLEAGGVATQADVAAVESTAGAGVQDVVFVTVKATALASIVDMLPPLVGPATRVVFAQNGMTWWYRIGLPADHPPVPDVPPFPLADAFLGILAPEQVVGAVVYSANEVIAPGRIRNNSVGRNVVEIASLVDADDAAVAALRARLVAAKGDSPPVTDLRASLWGKLIGNASASPISVATGNPSSIVDDPRMRELFTRIVAELLATARAYGYNLTSSFDVDRWTRNRSSHRPSMLQDHDAGRPLELDEIVLAPGRFARHAGVPTPSLDAVAAIVAQLAARRAG